MKQLVGLLMAMFLFWGEYSSGSDYCKAKADGILGDRSLLNIDLGTFDRPKVKKVPDSDGRATTIGKFESSSARVWVTKKNFYSSRSTGEDSAIWIYYDEKNDTNGSLTQGSLTPLKLPAKSVLFKLNSSCDVLSVSVESSIGWTTFNSKSCAKIANDEIFCKYLSSSPAAQESSVLKSKESAK